MIFTPDQLANMTDRSVADIEYFVVHHTAAIDEDEDIVDISQEEMRDQGFIAVGYHAVIHGNGLIQYGRPMTKVPAANLGLNTQSYAVSLEGNFQPGAPGYSGEKPTDAQIKSLVGIILHVKKTVPTLKYLIGHRDVARIVGVPSDATACPGDNLYSRMHELRVATGLKSA